MKLLIDQNLSDRLVARLEGRFPGSTHVNRLGLERYDDPVLWDRCRADGYVLLTKDSDFENAIEHPGPPPKVILVTIGNSSTDAVLALLHANEGRIAAFENDADRVLAL